MKRKVEYMHIIYILAICIHIYTIHLFLYTNTCIHIHIFFITYLSCVYVL